mmetsp:Transcript_75653/g.196918  ORF Transcript_75653/g.196918 Transcript_75653/m.196918 type:complete len:112 (-) Transcript_75653:373-708(-)
MTAQMSTESACKAWRSWIYSQEVGNMFLLCPGIVLLLQALFWGTTCTFVGAYCAPRCRQAANQEAGLATTSVPLSVSISGNQDGSRCQTCINPGQGQRLSQSPESLLFAGA